MVTLSGFNSALRPVRRVLTPILVSAGLAALVLGGMIANPLHRPPMLPSIADGVKNADRSEMAQVSTMQARDGTRLAFRHYRPEGSVRGSMILIHGSSGSSAAMHPLARVLAARGIESWLPDMRGHGSSGTRGDIGYLGQLDDDLADMVAMIRASGNSQPLTLLGHSSGGGFALRIAGSRYQDLFADTVLLAPWLGTTAPSSRPNAGGWASPNLPRIIALSILRGFGVTCCDGLPVIAFAVPPNSQAILTGIYSMRLLTNFGATRDYKSDLNGARGSISLIGAGDDELMYSSAYAQTVGGTSAKVDVRVLDGAGHMAVVSDPQVMARVADILLERIGK